MSDALNCKHDVFADTCPWCQVAHLKSELEKCRVELDRNPSDEEVDYGHIIKFWNDHTAPSNPHHSIHEYLEWLWDQHTRLHTSEQRVKELESEVEELKLEIKGYAQ